MISRLICLLFATACLSGCVLIDSYFISHYDGNEFAAISDVRAHASVYKTQCANYAVSKINALDLAERTQYFQYYEEHVPVNQDGYNSSKNLNAMAQDLNAMYQKNAKVSKIYCELKLGAIENSSNLIQNVLAGRPR
jgi:hypothetical protein